jgi:hypothetical protein
VCYSACLPHRQRLTKDGLVVCSLTVAVGDSRDSSGFGEAAFEHGGIVQLGGRFELHAWAMYMRIALMKGAGGLAGDCGEGSAESETPGPARERNVFCFAGGRGEEQTGQANVVVLGEAVPGGLVEERVSKEEFPWR